MDANGEMSLVEQTVVDVTEYGQLQLDKFKLRLLDNSATLLGRIFAVLVMVILAGFAALCLAFALAWWIGVMIGSFPLAAVIVAGVFLVAMLMVFLFRRRVIVNAAVRMLARLFFENDKGQGKEGYE